METPFTFPHEQHAIDKIVAALGQYIAFIPNYFLYDPATNQYFECDLIAISSDRIDIIELKHWTGEIDVRAYNWLVNGRSRPDPHKSNKYKCQILRSFYEKSFAYLPSVWVESVVVLTNPEAQVRHAHPYKTDQHNPTFFGLDTLIKHYRSRCVPEHVKLREDDVKKVAAKLRTQAAGPRQKALTIPGFDVLENLTQQPHKIELLARQTGNELQTVKRLRVFTFDPTISSAERKEQRNKALNSLKALEQIGDHPNVIKVWQLPHEDGHVIEVSDWSDDGTLADVIREQAPLSVEKAMPIVRGIVEGLRVTHAQMIVHRHLTPHDILMVGDTPKLMNFDLSYIPEDNRMTVLPEASALKPSPYLAPELYEKQDFTEATDVFSVGVILYELLCGKPPFTFSLYLKGHQGVLAEDALEQLQAHQVPENIRRLLCAFIQQDREKRPQDIEEVLEMLDDVIPVPPQISSESRLNRHLEPGEDHDVYQIQAWLGDGREAQVYRAKQAPGRDVALKLFHYAIPNERIWAERNALKRVSSPYIIRCENPGKWSDDRMYVVFDLIEGRSLQDEIEQGVRPSLETFIHVTRCLFEALDVMHNPPERGVPLLHNDIKPANILLAATHDPVIIDFGTASEPYVGAYTGTPDYTAPDLLQGVDFEFCQSGDLFALGMTLCEWLCGHRPYTGTPSVAEIPRSIAEFRNDVPEALTTWLLKSVQPLQEDRFEDIQHMITAFERIWADEEHAEEPEYTETEEKTHTQQFTVSGSEPIHGNPFVAYLNTLHNATAANPNALAESQALHPYFGSIHVSLALTDFIERELTGHDGSHVILTGHAGDGKSTIGLELYKRLKQIPMMQPLREPLKPIENILTEAGNSISLIKDMSELSGAERIANILNAAQGELGKQRWFIISNTGTLLNTLQSAAEKTGQNRFALENEMLRLLEKPDPGVFHLLNGRFTVLNLARIDNIAISGKLLRKLVMSEHWERCEGCDIAVSCPIYCNVKALQEHQEIVITRIEWIYRRLFEYGHRLTVRQISAHLAYSLTAGLEYHDIREMASQAVPPDLTQFLFSNRFFGYRAAEEDEQARRLTAVRALLPLEMGAKPYAILERRVWMNESGILPELPSILTSLSQSIKESIRTNSGEQAAFPSRMRQQLRRLFYLFGDFPDDLHGFLANFLESQMLQEVETWQSSGKGPNALRRDMLKKQVLHVLQERYTGVRLPEHRALHDLFITMKRGNDEIRQSVQIILAKIPLSNFALEFSLINTQFEPHRYMLTLVEKYSKEELRLELPFLDFVMLRSMGEVGQQLNMAYIDRLERFKAVLLESEHYKLQDLELLELTNDGQFQTRRLIFDDKTLQVM
jgi:serine/threonine protein kinase